MTEPDPLRPQPSLSCEQCPAAADFEVLLGAVRVKMFLCDWHCEAAGRFAESTGKDFTATRLAVRAYR